jgi:erythromycin esterase
MACKESTGKQWARRIGKLGDEGRGAVVSSGVIGVIGAALVFSCRAPVTLSEPASPAGAERASSAALELAPPHRPTSALHGERWSAPFSAEQRALFEAVTRDIGDARVVALGEQSHFGLATLELKLELLRYLHQELGFQRLVMEASLFSCAEAARALAAGQGTLEAARLCAFPRGLCRNGSYMLFDYLRWAHDRGQPLALSGMDPQLSGTAPRELLQRRLSEALGAPLAPNEALAVENMLSLELVRSAEQRMQDRAALHALSGRLRQRLGTHAFEAHVADGLLFLDEDHWDYQNRHSVTRQMESLRDREMGQNVLWIAAQHPGEKLVVWLANWHGSRTLAGYSSGEDSAPPAGYMVPAGQWLADALGDGYYSLAVSAASGKTGMQREGDTYDLNLARPGMLEHDVLGSGASFRLFLRAELARAGDRAQTFVYGAPATANWSVIFDGILFVREERPAVGPAAGCE